MTTENKPIILWIHGFCGRPNNETFLEMRKQNPQYEWYSIEVDHHAKASMEKINNYIRTHDVGLVAGTSLGGYYAMCADFNGCKWVVNPVMDPVRDLRMFLGQNTYKPGRPDGQTDFDFTEEMLMEFAELQLGDLTHVLCHYTAHDQVLGEEIKKDYEKTFYFLQQIDEKLLPGHFLTYKYAKAIKETISHWIERSAFISQNPYHCFGIDYELLPKHILPALEVAHTRMRGANNWPKILQDVESCIKEVYDQDRKQRPYYCNRIREENKQTLHLLLTERKYILNEMFNLTQETFEQFQTINRNLLDMHNRMVDKMAALYSNWLEHEEDGWQNDCQVKGKIIVEQVKEDYPDDGSDSDHEWMMNLIEELSGNRLIDIEFSGCPDKSCDRFHLNLEHDQPNIYFSGGGEKPFGDFLMCRAFQNLEFESLYAPQDILRIAYYWCDVALEHQRITNEKGDLL